MAHHVACRRFDRETRIGVAAKQPGPGACGTAVFGGVASARNPPAQWD
ncbi:hypothetical protein I547_4150 [Mycobacterium kansasii 824]|uniref:Uncharacterized protein n=1 Tax=Mycobacterium kansasii TaxID=1768 RepID=A0A1V3XGD1_MYCKA|nr:hypothetical protein I547_4150 [Mycobacterium kansasii 824]OOK78267.1 hypothetical protein BZL30_1898 [Mycobacterium kansasii]